MRVLLMLVSLAGIIFVTTVAAQSRGLVTTTNCPYSCKDAGIPPEQCREWSSGDRCMVEDLRQPPGHRTMYRKTQVDASSSGLFQDRDPRARQR